jgi:hypothetical protein
MLCGQPSTAAGKLAADLAMRSVQRQALEFIATAPAIRPPFGNPADISDGNPEHGQFQLEVTVGVPNFAVLFEYATQTEIIAQTASRLCGRQPVRQISRGEFPETSEEAFSGPLP